MAEALFRIVLNINHELVELDNIFKKYPNNIDTLYSGMTTEVCHECNGTGIPIILQDVTYRGKKVSCNSCGGTGRLDIEEKVLFIKGTRFPVLDNDGLDIYKARNLVSDTPFYPLYSVDCVEQILKLMYIKECNDKKLFVNNVLFQKHDMVKHNLELHGCNISNLNNGEMFITENMLNNDIGYAIHTINKYLEEDEISIVEHIITNIFDKFYSAIPKAYRNNVIRFSTDSENFVCELGIDIRAFRFEELYASGNYD